MQLEQLPTWFPTVIITLSLWSLPWKGIALWKAAKNSDTGWFVIFMIVNTIGILEILYIFVWGNKNKG